MTIFFYMIAVIFTGAFIWLIVPYSPLRKVFQNGYESLTERVELHSKNFSEDLLSTKPQLLQKYIHYCGLYGKPMMKASITVHNNADFLLNEQGPMTKINYVQANFATICERLAFIDTKLFKVLPFQGLDDNMDGKGKMKGVVAKIFTVFNVMGKEMDTSALVTVLAEALVCPSFFLCNDIVWEEIDEHHLQATLTQYKMTVSGIFEFDDAGAIISFYTKDRFEENHGTMTRRDWRTEFGGYIEIDGIKRPTVFKAFWVYPDCEKLYFNCSNVAVEYK